MSEACREPRTGRLEASELTGMERSTGTTSGSNPTRNIEDSYVCSCDPDFHPVSKDSLPTSNAAAAREHKPTLENGHFLTPQPVAQWGSCSNIDSAGYLKLRASSRSLLDDLVSQIASSSSRKEPEPILVRCHSAEDVIANNYDHLATSTSTEQRTKSCTPANGSDVRIHVSCRSTGDSITSNYDHLATDVSAEEKARTVKPSSSANGIRVQIYSRTKQVSKECIETEV